MNSDPGAAWLEIIVPARNEATRLPDGLAALCAKAATMPPGVAIIVVDSASTDSTGEIVRQWPSQPVPVRLIRCDRRGKGAAVRAGLLATMAPYVGFCDADMATDLAALDVAVSLLAGGHCAVVGSRAHPDSVVDSRHSVVRRVGAAAFRFAARLLVPGVGDSQCGFKFFNGPTARQAAAAMRATGFAFDVELLARCRRLARLPTVEIPVTWKDVPGSTFSIRRHSVLAFWEIGAIWLALRRRTHVSKGSAFADCASPGAAVAAGPGDGTRASADDAGTRLMAGWRVAVINWRDPWHQEAGGAERYAWEMAGGLRRRGADVRYVTARARGQRRREHIEGIGIARMGGRFTIYPLVLAWLAARRWSFDAVIDCQNGIPFFSPWVLPRRTRVVCVVHHVHDAQFGVHFPPVVAAIGRMLEGPVARRCYKGRPCVAVSQSTASAMRSRLGWTGPIDVIPNGLSADCFEAPRAGSEPGVLAGPLVLTVVGRLVAHKRIDRVLAIADRLARTGVRIDIIGRGPEAGQLAGQIAARGLTDAVRLRGYLPDEEKRAAVAASVLHLSTSQGEGWGLCVLEAAALGVPTVAYDVDGLRDAVRNGETGWLVGDGELIEDVTERALKELADPARRAELAVACRSWASCFDWDHSAAQLARLLAAPQVAAAPSLRGCLDGAQETGYTG